MSVLVRFAPSPTGKLHVGNIRVALINFLLAGGQPENLILRYDDTDFERSKQEHVDDIARDLRWLGIHWGQTFYQSKRLDLYNAARDRLIADGRLYPCYETAEELEYMRNRQRMRGRPPIYDRSALSLTAEQIAAYEAEGRRPHWRFRLTEGEIRWTDLVRGECVYDAAHLADPVVIREDGTYLYMLPSAIDDADMGITHVVRGEDHVTNTAVQIQMFQALGAAVPAFAHLPLLVGVDGKGLSKRLGSLSMGDLRGQGIEPLSICSLLSRLGSSEAIDLAPGMDALIAAFDISHFGRSTPRFDPAELDRLNQKLLHQLPWDVAQARLHAAGCAQATEAFWDAVRGNLTVFADVTAWYQVVYGPAAPLAVDGVDPAFRQAALACLPDGVWSPETWKQWTDAVKAATGAKGKDLFLPLRRLLTGHDHGPELKALLPLIGRDRAVARLAG
ncbi:glutamate--tRNA ligase [Novispirillum itersonii]|uniref:glutamate--tRNA ligase n=1 Tax=Novispirillum itersonii TaxID=189 RepID=UPI000379431D|nr:glutamate--tRNA ligase [Novispirillum itersonii]